MKNLKIKTKVEEIEGKVIYSLELSDDKGWGYSFHTKDKKEFDFRKRLIETLKNYYESP